MKRTFLIVLAAMIAAHAFGQYGYTLPYDSNLFSDALIADMHATDGILDLNHWAGAPLPSNWLTTYYIRGAVNFDGTGGSIASTVKPPTGERARIIQGVGIRSDMGRWHPVSELVNEETIEEGGSSPYHDFWAGRFQNVAVGCTAYYVDLSEIIGNYLTIGWPKSTGLSTITKNSVTGSEGLQRPINPAVDAFRPDNLSADDPVKPIACSLDYVQASGFRTYDVPLTYARDQVPSNGRFFVWRRAFVDANHPVDDGLTLNYPPSGGRTHFAWEGWRLPYSPDWRDLRVVTFESAEYNADNIGVADGPGNWNRFQSDYVNKFVLAANPFVTGAATTKFNVDQRFALVNAPEYLRNPGDMVVSYAQKRIYFIPYTDAHISGIEDTAAQVLNVSLPSEHDVQGGVLTTTYAAPLMIQNRPGFRLEDVDFSCCAGAGLFLKSVGSESNANQGMRITGCSFRNGGLMGLQAQHTWNTTIDNSYFYNMQGRAIQFTHAIYDANGLDAISTYKPHRTQSRLNHMIFGCSFSNLGTLHPSLIAVRLSNKPCGIDIGSNSFYHVSGGAILFTGTQVWLDENIFHYCATEVAENGVVMAGRSFSNFGDQITSNSFHDCAHWPDFGSNSFDQNLAGIMLDDGMSGVDVVDNHLQDISSAPLLSQSIPFFVNGGSFNRFMWNTLPSTGTVMQGYTTVNGIHADGTYLAGGDLNQMIADAYPIPYNASNSTTEDWKYNSTEFTSIFSNSAAFSSNSGQAYYGLDLTRSTGHEPYGFDGVDRKWLTAYWFDDTAKKNEWFVPYGGAYGLRMRGNLFYYHSSLTGNSGAQTRILGHINQSPQASNAVTFIDQAPPSPWTMVHIGGPDNPMP